MFILLLETKNGVNGKAIRLMEDQDEGKYQIWRGQYEPGQTEQGKWEQKGEYTDLDNALGVYCTLIPSLLDSV
ncbi:hypothetical protein ES703_04931 [subsurface metagenome]